MTQEIKTIDYQKQFLRRILFWLIIVSGVFLIGYLLMGMDLFLDEEFVYVPVSINAIEIADYQLDAPGMVNPVNLSIIADVLQDQNTSFETSEVSPNTPIVTSTPNPLTTTPISNATSVNPTSVVNATLNVPVVLPSLEPVISTVLAPLPPVPPLPEVVPTLVDEIIPDVIDDVLPIP